MKNVEYRVTFVFLLMLAGMSPLGAQKPDTLYIYETVIEHDTLVTRDTTWVHDTLYLRQNQPHQDVRQVVDSAAQNQPPIQFSKRRSDIVNRVRNANECRCHISVTSSNWSCATRPA